MKHFFATLLDFITGGFFNYLGALARMPFSKKSYTALVEETQSNNYGMLVMSVLLLFFFMYYKFSL